MLVVGFWLGWRPNGPYAGGRGLKGKPSLLRAGGHQGEGRTGIFRHVQPPAHRAYAPKGERALHFSKQFLLAQTLFFLCLNSEMPVGAFCGDSSLGGPLDKALLNQEGFIDIFQCILLFAYSR